MSRLSPRLASGPQTLKELYWAISLISLQGFGGVLPVAQREFVENHKWLTLQEFIEDWSVAQVLPGPNVVNLAIIFGGKCFGIIGSIVSLAGMLSIPMVLLMLIAAFFNHFHGNVVVIGVLRGMGIVASGLIAGSVLKMASVLKKHPLGFWKCILIAVACFVGIVVFHISFVILLLTLGLLSMVLTYFQLIKQVNHE